MAAPLHTGHAGTARLCQEPVCRAARLRYQKRWKVEAERGLRRSVDPTPAQNHVASLLGAGWSARAIAAEAGLATSTIVRLRERTNKQLGRDVAAAVRGVQGLPSRAYDTSLEPFVSRVGTVRRIQALLFLGWTHRHMSEMAGVSTHLLLSKQGRWVTRTTHDGVAAVYRELAGRAGPSLRNKRRARRLGYVGPLAWDDIDLDAEPELDDDQERSRLHEAVDPVVVERILAGQATDANPSERREVVRRWDETGRPLNDLERLTGWQVRRYRETDGQVAS